MRSELAASQGWHYKANISTVVHDAMCRADGNDIYLEEGFTDKASRFYTPREFAEMAVEQSRNLRWRVDGCETWLPQMYISLLIGGWSRHGQKPTAFEGDVMAELRKLAITEFTALSAAAGDSSVPAIRPTDRGHRRGDRASRHQSGEVIEVAHSRLRDVDGLRLPALFRPTLPGPQSARPTRSRGRIEESAAVL